jgi:hypothetical protein
VIEKASGGVGPKVAGAHRENQRAAPGQRSTERKPGEPSLAWHWTHRAPDVSGAAVGGAVMSSATAATRELPEPRPLRRAAKA